MKIEIDVASTERKNKKKINEVINKVNATYMTNL